MIATEDFIEIKGNNNKPVTFISTAYNIIISLKL
jgi:hypothetical protein